MLPSLLAREVQSGLKHFLTAAYEPSDLHFAGIVERFTRDEKRWMKGPYVQIGLPFRVGVAGKGFFAGFETEHAGFVHQEQAWQRLASDREAGATLVATGTGSGKTECFLYPVLDHCARALERGERGIKALVIYPMNALASDQARRFAQEIARTPAFAALRVGLFVGGRTGPDSRGQMSMTASEVITDRQTLRNDPPDILLTNYKMLDYLLIRPKDRQLWAHNQPETLRYVVVDELHTFDGAQGTDLALLLRRLKARLQAPAGHTICVGTSATLGANADAAPLREYARQIFGVPFDEDSVVTENRLSEGEFLGEGAIEHVLNTRGDMETVLQPGRYKSQQEAVAAWFALFFPGLPKPVSVDEPVWRQELGGALKKHLLFANLLKLLRGQIISLDELQQQMQKPFAELDRPHISGVLDALLALVAWARDEKGRPLVTLRVQLWLRELRRMVAPVCADSKRIELLASSDLNRDKGGLFLPLIRCGDCHTTGWLSRMSTGQQRIGTDLDEIYNTWFANHPEAVRLYARAAIKRPHCEGVEQRLCGQCGQLQSGAEQCIACGNPELVEVFRVTALHTSASREGVTYNKHDPVCPACGSRFRLLLLGARNATLGTVAIEQSWASPFNDDKKLIAFSDSVQDAAHRAGFFSARAYMNAVRTGLAQVIDRVAQPECAWPEFLHQAAALWREQGTAWHMSDERFVSEFIGPNMVWQKDWAEGLQRHDALPARSRLPGRVEKRLGWQAFAEFTYLSRNGRNLEGIGKATLAPRLASLERAAAALVPVLHEQYGVRHATPQSVLQWLWGFVTHLRQRGGVRHPEMEAYAADGNIFAFARTAGRQEWLPGMGQRTPHPVFLLLGQAHGFDSLLGQGRPTFFQTWLLAALGGGGYLMPEGADGPMYLEAIQALEKEGVLVRLKGDNGDAVALNPDALWLYAEVAQLQSKAGLRRLSVPSEAAEALLGMPCLDAPQEAYETHQKNNTWLARQFSRGDLRRVFSAEHTGLLQREQREALELRFKSKQPQPWYENLLSATPTLEMGVDIGDLSSVLLCSVPPTQASYLQRIGRAGRRDGNAFTATMADGASPHDLYFFEDTEEMLRGEVVPPGIFLKAPEVLRRQLFAFCLDAWVGSGVAASALPDKTSEALNALDAVDEGRFPGIFFAFVGREEDRLLEGFKAILGTDLDARVEQRLEAFMRGTEEEDSLKLRLQKLLEELSKERKSHNQRRENIKGQIAEIKRRPQDDATREDIEQLERERRKAMEVVSEINQRELLNTLTDAGLIPNYAFPEAGVELKSLLWRKKSSDDPEGVGAYISLPAERYERPANSALSEFAPENVFYANQRRVEIDQINVGLSSLEEWRLCPSCQHMENLALRADGLAACPRCGDPMWANVSQKRVLLRFKQAIANSNDTEARIDDSTEDREPKFYVRQMLSDFEPKDIKQAYRLKKEDLPFGFEFIERVSFRDVNFGEPTKPGESYSVGGQLKPRPGFKLCRQCGQVQRPPKNKHEREMGQFHAFDCPSRGSNEPENLVECLYLYREFVSEALRILVPYTRSGVDEASIQSFMAAVRIGLKRRFGGKVDHVRLITQEEKGRDGAANRHYVMLYDSVPGGTGYLHELLADGATTLVEVLKLALTHLSECACNQDPEKDGCYRCVYQHRLGRSMALVSRDRARAILEELVGGLEHLEKVESIADIYINPHFDSELESRFIESLRRLSRVNGLPVVRLTQEIVRGKSGFLLEVGEQRYWVEPQVDLGATEGVRQACRPDFVVSPVRGRSPRRPVAVFCDGWTYHQHSTQSDAAKRNALVQSGRFWVWSLTWQDVQTALESSWEGGVNAGLAGTAPGLLSSGMAPKYAEELWSENAVSGLLRWLATSCAEERDSHEDRLAMHAAATLVPFIPHPHSDSHAETRRLLEQFWTGVQPLHCDRPTKSAVCGNVEGSGVFFRYYWPAALLSSATRPPASPGVVVYDPDQCGTDPDRHDAWRKWLGLFNILQTLPGFLLATRTGLDTGDHGVFSEPVTERKTGGEGGLGAAHLAAWNDFIEQSLSTLSGGLEKLREDGQPPPDECGYEWAENGVIIAECELAWCTRKIVLLLEAQQDAEPVWATKGWTPIVAQEGWVERLAAALSGAGAP
jgi:DEAD/DEAH box helicase domain-containing protein